MASNRYRTTSVQRRDVKPEQERLLPLWTHPAVKYYFDEWVLIRDASAGEKEIKDAGRYYLAKLDGQDDAEYAAYLDRATYYNFTGRTISALIGTLFKRQHKIEGLPKKLETALENITRANASFVTFAKSAAEEYLSMGRFGILADLPGKASTQPKPYLAGYIAENILDWTHEVVDEETGREVLSKVVLREFVPGRDATTGANRYYARYRVLCMEPEIEGSEVGPRVYVQYLYELKNGDADITVGNHTRRVVPKRRGKPLDFIPFVFLGRCEVEKPPMLDIARLNISHYRSYAHLEHGRFFTGLPVYYVEGEVGDDADFTIGPAVVWITQKGMKPGLLEFNGQGLKFLENACFQKESQAASLGGRMIGVTAQSTAETDNQTKIKDRNEQSLLMQCSHVLDEAFTQALRWWAWMANESQEAVEAITVLFNKDFLYDTVGSREFRAIQSMYKDGLLPVEVFYDYMRKAEVIPDSMTEDEFVGLLQNAASFPNQPDFAARQEGYPNAQAKVSAEAKDRELDLGEAELEQEADEAELDREAAERTAKATAKAAEAAAKAQPKGEPGVARQVSQQRTQSRPAPGPDKPPQK